MDSTSFEGFVLDPSKCSKLSMEEKREIVYELSKWSHGAPELLKSWSRQEILQILCAEMGKERKYTGLTKLKIIENLLKVVSEKKLQERGTVTDPDQRPSAAVGQRTAKRPRKTDHPSRLPVAANTDSINNVDNDLGNTIYCKNSACKAKLRRVDAFCKRCSCCICCQYDDNKDPSLWLTCSSEPPFRGDSCCLSCHLECALRQERSGIARSGRDTGLDGSFYCVSCGKVNDLLGCWRKQMITARDTRRVDILCYRVSLSQKLLSGTTSYQKLHGIVDEAMKKLVADVGPLTGLPVKKARGIVNRLSSGPEVQRLCALALETLDLMLSNSGFSMTSDPVIQDSNLIAPLIRFEDISTSSLTVILGSEDPSLENVESYTLWHRKADDMDYPAEPTCTKLAPSTKFSLSSLTPATDYLFKVISFDGTSELGTHEVQFQTCSASEEVQNPKSLEVERSHSPATNCSSLSSPYSVEDENNNVIAYKSENKNQVDNYLACCKNTEKFISTDLSNEVDCTDTDQREPQGDSVSMLDEEHAMEKINFIPNSAAVNFENKHFPEGQTIEETSTENGSNSPVQSSMECVPFLGSSEASLPITPCKLESFKDGLGRNIRSKLSNKDLDNGSGREEEPQDGSSFKKRSGERRDEDFAENGDRDFGYYVKVIRWLERKGHIETSFRQKFLTWYSLQATPQEVRIVKVFVDTLVEDPSSLAGQLLDTFTEVISNKRSSVVPMGFCLKLWH